MTVQYEHATVRDEVWDAALKELSTEGRFRMSDLGLDDSKRHTARRVLKAMQELGWLTRTGDTGKVWYAGDLAKKHLDLSDRAKVLSDPDFEI